MGRPKSKAADSAAALVDAPGHFILPLPIRRGRRALLSEREIRFLAGARVGRLGDEAGEA